MKISTNIGNFHNYNSCKMKRATLNTTITFLKIRPVKSITGAVYITIINLFLIQSNYL